MRSFNEKLAEFRQLVHDCSFLNAELRDMSPLEQVFLGIGDVMRKENISVEYPRSKSPERPAKSTCSEAVAQPIPSIAAQEKSEPSASEAKTGNYILPPIGAEEFEEIPKYMRGRMSAAELNEVDYIIDSFKIQRVLVGKTSTSKCSLQEVAHER
ncbi:hypothetical protein OESDEN_14818 [Oesophagostomum dentatum]|uniref:SKA complex subunit 1 n=1 Tax=Oesophagostomum dentatum TaxID=61180 RepID=A0A0B1SJE1_OESDE|nr:hypothetical protein OESDEN_14818 [Oesophagostomum dentatum]